MPLTIAFVLYQ